LQPPRLIFPNIAAVILALFALAYSVILLWFIFSLFRSLDVGEILYFTMLLGLATTPFPAIVYLRKLRYGSIGKAAILMVFIMGCPSLYWGVVFLEAILDVRLDDLGELFSLLGLVGIPAGLSIYLAIVFALFALQGKKKGKLDQSRRAA